MYEFGGTLMGVTPQIDLYYSYNSENLQAYFGSFPRRETGMGLFRLYQQSRCTIYETMMNRISCDLLIRNAAQLVTLNSQKPVPRRGPDSYQEDSDAISMLHDMTRERSGLAMQLIHHNRKDIMFSFS